MTRIRAFGPSRIARVAALVLLVLAWGANAQAASIILGTAATQFAQDVSDPLAPLVATSSGCFTGASTGSVATGISSGGPCRGSLTLPVGSGSFTGVAAGRGVFDANGLQLGVEAAVDISRTLGSVGPGVYAYGVGLSSSALFQDLVTLLGAGTGTPGFLRLTFNVDGLVQLGPEGGFTVVSAFPSLEVNGLVRGLTSGNNILVFDVPLLFGLESSLNVRLAAPVTARMLVPPDTFAHADFLNTATLTLAQVLDGNKNVLPGGRIVSSSGLSYQADEPVGSVPEPGAVALFGVGLAYWSMRRKGRI